MKVNLNITYIVKYRDDKGKVGELRFDYVNQMVLWVASVCKDDGYEIIKCETNIEGNDESESSHWYP